MSVEQDDATMAVSTNYEDTLQNMEVDVKMSDSALRAHSEKRMVESKQQDTKTVIEASTQENPDKAEKTSLFSVGTYERQQPHSGLSSQNISAPNLIQIMSVIKEMSLSSLALGDYLVIVKADFDMVLSDEPYLALMLLLNTVTGKYITRIWNQTVSTGTISSVDQLRAACMRHFDHMPCMGLPFAENELEEADFDFMVSHAPVLCKISKSCLKVMSKHAHSQVRSCSECLRFKHSSDPKECKLPPTRQVKNLSDSKGKGSTLHLANQALYLQEIAKKYPHVIKSGKPFKIKIKTEDSTGCLQNKVLLVDPTQTLQQGGIVETLTEEDTFQPKRENPIKNINAVESSNESGQSEDLEETKMSDIKEELEEIGDADLPATNRQIDNDIGIKQEESIHTKKMEIIEFPSGPSNPQKCSTCGKEVANIGSLKRHNMLVHQMGRFKCLECGFGAAFAKDIVEHMEEQNHVDEPYVRCPSCKEKHNMTEITSHFANCKKVLARESKKIVNKMKINEMGEIVPYMGMNSIFPKKCLLCESTLQTYRSFKNHLKSVHHAGNFQCSSCQIRAVFPKHLVQHMENEHPDEPSVICPQCGDKYDKKDIVSHYDVCLKNARKIDDQCKKMCQTCGKTFSSKHSYNNHIKRHHRATKEFFYCDQCARQFCSKVNLKNHIQVEHENMEFECITCKQTFRTKREKDEHHILEHSLDEKYNCEYCGKRFGLTVKLQNHIRHHHEPPKFKCQYCGKLFKQMQTLEGHERMHRGEKPFLCTHCPESFARSGGLSQHLRGVHKIAKRGGKVGWGHWGKGKGVESLG